MLRNQKGASAVEFAIVLPLFVIITFGIIELSLLIHAQAVITNASREGARVGIFYEGPAVTNLEITTNVKNRIADEILYNRTESRMINLGGTDLTNAELKALIGVAFVGNFIVVTLDYPYEFLLWPDFLTISATTQMKREEF
jgi:Flp pilus assembly protein TadG